MDDHQPIPRDETAPSRSMSDLLSELWELIATYVRQETVDPIKAVGRYIAFGVVGAFLVGTGVVLLAVGGLRALQEETDTAFTGSLTWIPYAIAFAVLAVGGAVSLMAISGRNRRG